MPCLCPHLSAPRPDSAQSAPISVALSPLDSKEINQSTLKETSPEYSLEGLMLKAETPIFWPPDAKN